MKRFLLPALTTAAMIAIASPALANQCPTDTQCKTDKQCKVTKEGQSDKQCQTAKQCKAKTQCQTAVYLPTGSVDVASLIPPAPAAGSDAFNEELSIVLWAQETRTPEQIAFVSEKCDVDRFTPILGDALCAVNKAELKATINEAVEQIRADYDAAKDVYNQPRPFIVSDAVVPVESATLRDVPSYPSGHAVRGIVYARLLGELFPDKADELLDLGTQIGYGRVIAGVHYPIDVTAGQTLGHAYADVVIAQPVFQQAKQRIVGADCELKAVQPIMPPSAAVVD